MRETLHTLGAQLLQRDWLSANHIVFAGGHDAPATVVDTGYARHADMTVALVEQALGGQPLARIVNTHLHSDHCGGNRALQACHPAQTFVPAASVATARAWDESLLSYRATGQLCERFRVDGAVVPGGTLRLGPAEWQVHAAPGHDPDAVLLFEPQTRTLISGDALWEDRLAIIFPELFGEDGFGPARRTLDLIESLAPRCVLPGHGAAFADVAAALNASRRRLAAFERDPVRHAQHAARALVMFHMLEHQQRVRSELQAWLLGTPIFALSARVRAPRPTPASSAPRGGMSKVAEPHLLMSGSLPAPAPWARALVDQLLGDGWLVADGETVRLGLAAG